MSNRAHRNETFIYRLRHHQLTPAMENILKALDEWSDNNPSVASCQQIADIAGVHQTYVQSVIRSLEAEGYVKLWKHRNGTLKVPGVFPLKGFRVYSEGQ